MNKKILIMGGSPCSGKSTIAEMIAREYGAHYFKVDDFLGEFMARAAAEGKETCQRYQGLSPDEIWLEDPAVQCRDEFLIYEEIPNTMKLTERTADLMLLFAPQESITAMVEGALTSSGMTGFTLSPVGIHKSELNGITCYQGASTITMEGETYDFSGHIFIRKDKLVLLIWVGDEVRYADELKIVHESLQAVR